MIPLGVLQQQVGGGTPFWSHTFTDLGGAVTLSDRLGIRFLLGASNMEINALSYYSAAPAVSENVRIHRVSDGVLIAEADILGTTNLWISGAITPVTLIAATEYTISHRSGGANRAVDRNNVSPVYDPNVTRTANVFGTSDSMPITTSSNRYEAARFGWE
jgi:hypothetical protein